MTAIIERAPAKINLGLDIQGKRPDGYHDLSMVLVSVDLCDYITVDHLEEDRILLTSNCPRLPINEHNDVYKAAYLLKERFKSQQVSLFSWIRGYLFVLVWEVAQVMRLQQSEH